MAENASIEMSELLPSSIEDLGEEIRRHMEEEGGAGGRVRWSAAGGAALKAIREQLSFDVARGFAAAWAEFEGLRDYRDAEKHPRGRDEPYSLGKNCVELEAEPLLVVSLGPFEAPPIRFGYTISAEFDAVELTIRDGAVQAAALAGCKIAGVLTLKERQLHEPCQLAAGRLPGRLEFDPPVPIP
jgi:hypothetical protein